MADAGVSGPTVPSRTRSPLRGLQLAVTIDDAPGTREGPAGEAAGDGGERMDRVGAALQAAGVGHCVAFAVGSWCADAQAHLHRWLAAGYEIGNHTHTHTRCSALEPESFAAEVGACDAVLAAAGAFAAGRPRWFRHPFLDRGVEGKREALRQHLVASGHRIAHGSIDWFDHAFDDRLLAAVRDGRTADAAAIERRYVATALAATAFEAARTRRRLGRAAAHVVYCHFGEATARCLPRILAALTAAGVEFCALDQALRDPLFAAFDRPPWPSGRVLPALFPPGPVGRARRALAAWSLRAGLFDQQRFGPRWPHWE